MLIGACEVNEWEWRVRDLRRYRMSVPARETETIGLRGYNRKTLTTTINLYITIRSYVQVCVYCEMRSEAAGGPGAFRVRATICKLTVGPHRVTSRSPTQVRGVRYARWHMYACRGDRSFQHLWRLRGDSHEASGDDDWGEYEPSKQPKSTNATET